MVRKTYMWWTAVASCLLVMLAGPAIASADESYIDLQPTLIFFDPAALAAGNTIHFDSGVKNDLSSESGVFNVKWRVDGREVGAYGSHESVPGNSTVRDGNSQFDWTFDTPGT